MFLRVVPLIMVGLLELVLAGCDDARVGKLGTYAYPDNTAVACSANSKAGAVGGATGEETQPSGYGFTVRTPANYRPTVAHPLIVVYAPAGLQAAANERGTGLTEPATAAGFIVAYAGHVKTAPAVVQELSTIPALIAEKWCIDSHRVFLTGHSDGGTVAQAMALLDTTMTIPAAIAPSAAGFTKTDFAEFKCRVPIPVLLFHSANDKLFPGFGAEAAAWWAACNQCKPEPRPTAKGCVVYPDCAGGVTTQYCEGTGPHAQWPAMNTQLIDFFTAAGTKK
jgi:polyhydroxybutyrate depolymerase